MGTLACFLCRQGRALSTHVCCHGCALPAQNTLAFPIQHTDTHTEPPKSAAPGKPRGLRRKGDKLLLWCWKGSPAARQSPEEGHEMRECGNRSPPRRQCPGECILAQQWEMLVYLERCEMELRPFAHIPLSPPTNKRRVCAHLMGIYVPFLQGRREDVELCVVL